MKKILLPIMVAVLVLGGLGASALQSDIKTNDFNVENDDATTTLGDGRIYTHTILGEFGTATTCTHCKYTHAALKNIFAAGWHPFYYVSLVDNRNTHAAQRLNEYNLAGTPTVYYDGGYRVNVGAYDNYPVDQNWQNNTITQCGPRPVADIDIDLSATWLGDATMQIDISVINNQAIPYDGRIRVFVTEEVSTMGWLDTAGNPYTFTFLDYAFNQVIDISPMGVWQDSMVWDGHNYNDGYGHTFGGITAGNTRVIAAAYNATWHQGYSNPPSGYPFAAYYVDETAGAEPTTGPDADESFVTLTNENLPFLITCPAGDGPLYQYVKVTVKNAGGNPMPGIPADAFSFALGNAGDATWFGTLSCTFTPVDTQTDANGEIRFTVKGDTSISGNMTIQATVQGVPLNDIDTLTCKSPDYFTDGQVSLGDFVIFGGDYGEVSWRSDFTGDGLVSLGDFVTFGGHYGH